MAEQNELFQFFDALSYSKKHLIDNEVSEEDAYIPFVTNKYFSRFEDSLLYVNEMNVRHGLDKKMQFDYLFYSLRKRKRFSKKIKTEKDETEQKISEVFQCNRRVARQYSKVINNITQLDIILDKGGVKSNKHDNTTIPNKQRKPRKKSVR